MFSIILDISTFFTYICVNDQNHGKLIKYYYITKGAFPMFGKKADDKIAKKQAEQEVKDKAAMVFYLHQRNGRLMIRIEKDR